VPGGGWSSRGGTGTRWAVGGNGTLSPQQAPLGAEDPRRYKREVRAEIRAAVAILDSGGVVAFPTETVYGLGADATDADAVQRLFDLKQRPAGRPLTVLLAPGADPGAWGEWGEQATTLARRFWPGPLTLVVPRRAPLPEVLTGGLPSIGLRVPDHPLAIELLEAFERGLAAPSANPSGQASATRAEHVRAAFADQVPLVLDGGPCRVGIESAVVELGSGSPRLLRPGAIPQDELEAVLGAPLRVARLQAGYAPRTPLRLARADELEALLRELGGHAAVLSFRQPDSPHARWLRAPADPPTYARRLYEMLHQLDQDGHPLLIVEAVPEGGAWAAVADRLRRATHVGLDASIRTT